MIDLTMDNTYSQNGFKSTILFVICSIFNWFTPENADFTFKIITGIGATVTAILAIVYYWYAIKLKKQELQKIK